MSVSVEGDILRCGICLDFMNDPVNGDCGHPFCKGCLQTSKISGNPKCPKCRQVLNDLTENPFARWMVSNLTVGCTYVNCSFKPDLADRNALQEHEANCR